jgi:hypothetical protein
MRAISRALFADLLQLHLDVCTPQPASPDVQACLITYGRLVERASVPISPRSVGPFLADIAAFCAEQGWPPLNALAVNQDTRMPGESYDLAQGCNLLDWPGQVERCILFRGYEAVPV